MEAELILDCILGSSTTLGNVLNACMKIEILGDDFWFEYVTNSWASPGGDELYESPSRKRGDVHVPTWCVRST